MNKAEEVKELFDRAKSLRKIEKELGFSSRSTVDYYLKRAEVKRALLETPLPRKGSTSTTESNMSMWNELRGVAPKDRIITLMDIKYDRVMADRPPDNEPFMTPMFNDNKWIQPVAGVFGLAVAALIAIGLLSG